MNNVLEEIYHWVGFGLCHQYPERSYAFGGLQFPVCARDTGMYLGILIGLVALYFIHKREHRTEFAPWYSLIALGIMLLSLAFDGVTSYAGLRESSNILRLATGLAGGFAISGMLYPIICDSIPPHPVRKRVLDTPLSLLLYVVVLGVAFIVIQWGFPFLGIAYSLLSLITIVVTFVLINMALVCTVAPKFTNKVASFRTAWLPLLISIALAAGEIYAMTALKLWVV